MTFAKRSSYFASRHREEALNKHLASEGAHAHDAIHHLSDV